MTAFSSKFPPYVDRPKNRNHKAQNRLKYMLSWAGLHKLGSTSIRRVSAAAKVDHSSVFCAIKRGAFSDQMATRFEETFGRDLLPKEFLIAPMSVVTVEA